MRKFRCAIILPRWLAEHRMTWTHLSTLLVIVTLSDMCLPSGASMIWSYSWIIRGVVTLYGQMAEVHSRNWTCLCMIRVSVCVVSFMPLIRQFSEPQQTKAKMYSLLLYDFLREQELGTGRSPDTDKADSFHSQIRWAKLN